MGGVTVDVMWSLFFSAVWQNERRALFFLLLLLFANYGVFIRYLVRILEVVGLVKYWRCIY
ncbi:hypothetical protein EPI10_025163 [Gossypium australe]|uniref:Uncharacterized protein n=1 Tax=Gossypium australe TaxID=47621 RepID=A0A5B6VZ87_9ROSI|nr:hypothetical protein EPI10_025163 [Gossypium australe]